MSDRRAYGSCSTQHRRVALRRPTRQKSRSLDTYRCGETGERRVVLAADEALRFSQDREQVVPADRDQPKVGYDRLRLGHFLLSLRLGPRLTAPAAVAWV